MDEVVNVCEYAVNCLNQIATTGFDLDFSDANRPSGQEMRPMDECLWMCDDQFVSWAEKTIRSYSQPEYCDYETARMVKLALHVFIKLCDERMRYLVSDGNREFDDSRVAQGI